MALTAVIFGARMVQYSKMFLLKSTNFSLYKNKELMFG